MGSKFRPGIASDIVRRSPTTKQLGQAVNHVLAVEPALDVDGQTFAAVFVDQGQHPERTSIVGLIVNKIATPYVIASLGPKAYATAVLQP